MDNSFTMSFRTNSWTLQNGSHYDPLRKELSRSHWQPRPIAATSPGQGRGCISSWGKTATLPGSSLPIWVMTSQRSSTPSTRSSLSSLAFASTSACPASTTSLGQPPRRGSQRTVRRCCLALARPVSLSRHCSHRWLYVPGHPSLTVTCWVRTPPVLSWKILLSCRGLLWTMWAKGSIWSEGTPGTGRPHPVWDPCPLKTISRVLTISAKDEPLWLPLRPLNSREQQTVWSWSPSKAADVHTGFWPETLFSMQRRLLADIYTQEHVKHMLKTAVWHSSTSYPMAVHRSCLLQRSVLPPFVF